MAGIAPRHVFRTEMLKLPRAILFRPFQRQLILIFQQFLCTKYTSQSLSFH